MEALARAAFVAPASRAGPLPRASRRSGSRFGGGTVVPGATRRGWGETDNRFSRLDKRGDRSARDDDRHDDSQRNISFQELRKRQDRELRKVRRSEHRRRRARESLSATICPPPPRAPPPLTHLPIPPSHPTGARRGRRLLGRRRRARRVVPFHGRGEQRQIRGAQEGQVATRRAVPPPRRPRLRRRRHRRRRSHRSPQARREHQDRVQARRSSSVGGGARGARGESRGGQGASRARRRIRRVRPRRARQRLRPRGSPRAHDRGDAQGGHAPHDGDSATGHPRARRRRGRGDPRRDGKREDVRVRAPDGGVRGLARSRRDQGSGTMLSFDDRAGAERGARATGGVHGGARGGVGGDERVSSSRRVFAVGQG